MAISTDPDGVSTGSAQRADDATGADHQPGRDATGPGTRGIGWVLFVTAGIGLIAAITLLIEKIKLLENPNYIPSCSLNPVLSCGSVMKTEQAEVFGFPNPVIGVAAFAILMTVGLVLVTGARVPGWFWWGVQGGTALGIVFTHWLMWQSLYSIKALCPYCMVVWVVTIIAFVATTAHNVYAGRLPGRSVLPPAGQLVTGVVLIWLVAIAALITVQFWYYWSTLL